MPFAYKIRAFNCKQRQLIAGNTVFVTAGGVKHISCYSFRVCLIKSNLFPLTVEFKKPTESNNLLDLSKRDHLGFSCLRDNFECTRLDLFSNFADCEMLFYYGGNQNTAFFIPGIFCTVLFVPLNIESRAIFIKMQLSI